MRSRSVPAVEVSVRRSMGKRSTETGFGVGMVGAPLAVLYGGVTLGRRWLYEQGYLKGVKASVPVLSVGGLEVGGSGKTPVTRWLMETLLKEGKHPALLTRGYGRASSGLVVRGVDEAAEPGMIGDEPAMLVAGGLNVPVGVSSSRAEAARAVLRRYNSDVLVLDDGFAHRALIRDLDVVVLRGEQPFGSGHLLPWGSLREPVSSLGRADVLWFHYKGLEGGDCPQGIRERFGDATIVVSEGIPTPARDLDGTLGALEGKRVLAATGIAHPRPFVEALERLGATVVGEVFYRDHFPFSRRESEALLREKERVGADEVVVTPKDAIKLKRVWPDASLMVVGVEVRLLQGQRELAERLGRLWE